VRRLGWAPPGFHALRRSPWGERIRRELPVTGAIWRQTCRLTEGARCRVYFRRVWRTARPVRGPLRDRRDSRSHRLTAPRWMGAGTGARRLVHLNGDSHPPRRVAAIARRARPRRAATVIVRHQLSRRPSGSPAEARSFLEPVLTRVRYLFIGQTRRRRCFGFAGLAPSRTLESLAAPWRPKGAIQPAAGRGGLHGAQTRPALQASRRLTVQMIDPIGAGDAYAPGLWALLRGRAPSRGRRRGHRGGGTQCSMWGDIALVTPQVRRPTVLAGGPDVRR